MKSFFLSTLIAFLFLSLSECYSGGLKGSVSSPISELTPETMYFLTSLNNSEKGIYLKKLCNVNTLGDSTKRFTPRNGSYQVIFNDDGGFELILGNETDYHRIISRIETKQEEKKGCLNYYHINNECHLCDKGGGETNGGFTLVISRKGCEPKTNKQTNKESQEQKIPGTLSPMPNDNNRNLGMPPRQNDDKLYGPPKRKKDGPKNKTKRKTKEELEEEARERRKNEIFG